jgi:hypothetical protein
MKLPASEAKTRSSSSVQCSRRLRPSSALAAWSINGTERTLPDFGVPRALAGVAAPDVDDPLGEVDVAPPQCPKFPEP